MAPGSVQEHQCFCVFMSLHFMCSLQGLLVFALLDSKGEKRKKHSGVWDFKKWYKAQFAR